ncbi:MAG: HDOD domain-containing protein [Gammaproteobacteria bacterium]|nr:HDOD domain-containing protein [Gammaproteobacteria bacterium]
MKEKNMESSQALIEKIKNEHQAGRLVLPSLPEIIVRVRQAVNDDDVNLGNVVKLIQVDPSLTARLVQIANSPLYRSRQPVENCLMAVNLLGLSTTRDLVTCLVLNNVFNAESKKLHKRVQKLWQHSCHVAAIASTIAKITPNLHEDTAMLAGLLHDIGVLPVLHYVADYPDILESEKKLDFVIQQLRASLGQQILKEWNFDPALIMVSAEAENWLRDTKEAADYADVVIVAQIHSFFGKDSNLDLPPLLSTPAFLKLGLSKMGADASLEVLFEAEQEIRDIMSMLG